MIRNESSIITLQKVSVLFVCVILIIIGQFLYRSSIKTLTIFVPFLVLLLLLIKARKCVDLRSINNVEICSYALILFGFLWIPLLYLYGQSSSSLFKDNHLLSTAINYLPYIACILCLVICSNFYESHEFAVTTKLYFILLIFLVGLLVVLVFELVGQKAFVTYFNGNWVAIGLYQLFVLKILVSKRGAGVGDIIFGGILAFMTSYYLESRSVLGAYFVFGFMIAYIKITRAKRFFVLLIFPMALLGSIVFTFMLSFFISQSGGQDLLGFASKHGKNALNGREYAWSDMWIIFMDFFWTGRGTGFLTVSTSMSADINAAVHNAWLDFGVKHGVFGVVVLFVFLCALGNELSKNVNDAKVMVVISYLVSCVIFLTFYNTFGYSHYCMQIISWLIIGCGLGRIRRLKKIESFKFVR